jgi:hypothetical protein
MMNVMKKACGFVNRTVVRPVCNAVSSAKAWMFGGGAVGGALIAQDAWATDPVTLPDVGVDVADIISAISTGLGAIIQPALLAAGAFFIIRIGYKWVRSLVR